MIIDHVNTIWFRSEHFSMLLIGRGTFPLFCYATAMMAHKATRKSLWKYTITMVILAVISQPFSQYALERGMSVNVIFTLALGGIFAVLARRMQAWQMCILYTLALLTLPLSAPLEYGFVGVAIPSAILLVMRGEKPAVFFLGLLIFAANASGMVNELMEGRTALWIVNIIIWAAAVFIPLAILDIAKNMSQKGRFLPKYALHVFYPGHLFLLKVFA